MFIPSHKHLDFLTRACSRDISVWYVKHNDSVPRVLGTFAEQSVAIATIARMLNSGRAVRAWLSHSGNEPGPTITVSESTLAR